uniref:Uncharacterized protein n=1 Tax=Chenopodium quinoa TaxID=63459 RepID=A0A803L3N4_CHEQI
MNLSFHTRSSSFSFLPTNNFHPLHLNKSNNTLYKFLHFSPSSRQFSALQHQFSKAPTHLSASSSATSSIANAEKEDKLPADIDITEIPEPNSRFSVAHNLRLFQLSMDSADTLHRFKRSIKAFLNKDNFNGALKLVVNRMVRCMEENGEETKGESLVYFLNTVASEFPELNLPSNPLHRLECLVNNLLSNGMVEDALKLTSAPKGISMAKSPEQQSLLEKLEQQLFEAEKKKKGETQPAPKEAKPVQIASVTSQEAALKLQQASEEAKRHGKQIVEGSEKAVETKDEGGRRGSISLVEERRPRNFKIELSVTMELDEDSFMGSTRTNTTEVQKSFIVVDQAQINNFQDLVHLCLRHETLLKVDQSFKMMDDDRFFLVTSEDVCTLYSFFKRKISILSPKSNEAWWDAIKDLFRKVFRGVIRGLMYLFDKDKACGNLVFNSFVNSEGEGRILPYMAAGKQKQDLIQLVDLMRSVIKLAVPSQSDLSFLPNHLEQYFDNVTQFHGSCPLEFVIDQPYFWNTAEKINFTFKLRELVKENPNPFRLFLDYHQLYQDWWQKLQHVYIKLFNNSMKRKKTVKGYRNAIDIVRFYGAVYTHINELEYKQDRNNKRFSDEKIESDLAKIFPDFYVHMFSALCSCNQKNMREVKGAGFCHEWLAGELFGMLISVLFMQEAVKGSLDENKRNTCTNVNMFDYLSCLNFAANGQGLFAEFRAPHGTKHGQQGDDYLLIYSNGLLALVFSFGVLFTSLKSVTARSWQYGTGWFRSFKADYGVPFLIVIWTLLSFFVPIRLSSEIPRRLDVPSSSSVTLSSGSCFCTKHVAADKQCKL